MHTSSRGARALLAIVAAAILGCSGGYGTAPAPGPVAGQWFFGDPVGDTVGSTGVRWDIMGMQISRDATSITVQLDLLQNVISPAGGDPAAMVATVDLDVDQDPATGARSAVDAFRSDGGATGIGADYRILLTEFAADSSVAVVDASGRTVGRVTPAIRNRHLMVRVPLAMLGNDDGILNAAAIVGTAGRPSDFIPNAGHLVVGATAN